MTVSQETNSNDNDNGNISVTSSNGSINTNINTINTSKPIVKAKLISASNESLISAGQRLRSGHLVSFPTETVYGLGCHALDPVAIRRVFQAKERPFTDPLIVHVNDVQHALQLWHAYSSSPTNNTNTNTTNTNTNTNTTTNTNTQ